MKWLPVLSVILVAGCTSAPPLPDHGPAPAYSVPLLDAEAQALQDMQGEVVLLNLWATWCKPCRYELPLLDALQAQHPELRIIAVSMDDSPNAEQEVRDYIADADVELEIAFDEGGRGFVPAFHSLGSRGAPPETFLISKDGRVVGIWNGLFDPEDPDNQDLLERALAA